jgi:hypothetical protein
MDIKPIVGQGHPLDPDRSKILSEDDEKRIDEKGNPIVEGKLWSKASTGLYLVIALHTVPLSADRLFKGHSEIDTGIHKFKLTMGVTEGKPTFLHDTVGACLELPDDLGTDAIKRQYVIEWIVDTVMEAFADRNIILKKEEVFTMNLVECVAHASDIAIQATGL